MPKLGHGWFTGHMRTLTYTLHTALRQMVDDSGINQDELAEACDISKGSVTNYIKGRTIPKWSTVERWANACGFDAADPMLRELWEQARRSDWLTPPRSYGQSHVAGAEACDGDQLALDLGAWN